MTGRAGVHGALGGVVGDPAGAARRRTGADPHHLAAAGDGSRFRRRLLRLVARLDRCRLCRARRRPVAAAGSWWCRSSDLGPGTRPASRGAVRQRRRSVRRRCRRSGRGVALATIRARCCRAPARRGSADFVFDPHVAADDSVGGRRGTSPTWRGMRPGSRASTRRRCGRRDQRTGRRAAVADVARRHAARRPRRHRMAQPLARRSAARRRAVRARRTVVVDGATIVRRLARRRSVSHSHATSTGSAGCVSSTSRARSDRDRARCPWAGGVESTALSSPCDRALARRPRSSPTTTTTSNATSAGRRPGHCVGRGRPPRAGVGRGRARRRHPLRPAIRRRSRAHAVLGPRRTDRPVAGRVHAASRLLVVAGVGRARARSARLDRSRTCLPAGVAGRVGAARRRRHGGDARAPHDRGWSTPERDGDDGQLVGRADRARRARSAPRAGGGGVVLYPVTDLAALAAFSHRFEAHYTDSLVGPAGRSRSTASVPRSPTPTASTCRCS